jgi:hypothetical protein
MLRLLSRMGNNLGERGRQDENDNQLQKGRSPRRRPLGGERRGEVTLSSSVSSSHKDYDVGQREGRRITTTIAGGEVASSLSSRGMGKDLGERVAGGRGTTCNDEGGARCQICRCCRLR